MDQKKFLQPGTFAKVSSPFRHPPETVEEEDDVLYLSFFCCPRCQVLNVPLTSPLSVGSLSSKDGRRPLATGSSTLSAQLHRHVAPQDLPRTTAPLAGRG